MLFNILLIFISVFAGGIASISGFGIGSFVTPYLSLKVDFGIAVASVSIVHFLGTILRFFIWRKFINKKIWLSFGLTSAAGGLVGALLHNVFYNNILTIIFGCLLVFAGTMELTGLMNKIRFSGIAVWIAGGLSGLFGGLVGNQGGIRSASMLGFNLERKEFVATATGIALMVDMARMPIYLVVQGKQILAIWQYIAIASAGVLVGTEIGIWLLKKIPENIFKKVVAGIILTVGIFVLTRL